MLVGYLIVKETAEKCGINRRTVQTMCNDGLIPHAIKFGNIWDIPEDTKKPADKRVISGNYKDKDWLIKIGALSTKKWTPKEVL